MDACATLFKGKAKETITKVRRTVQSNVNENARMCYATLCPETLPL